MKPWTLAAAFASLLLFVLALRSDVYQATSPSVLWWHVYLRKTYSIGAFALVGWLWERAFREHGRTLPAWNLVAGIATYSAAIEVGQALNGSREGLAWNAFDTACGAAGGAIASALRSIR